MSEEKDFFKTCFNRVAGLEVKNESQAIAKEVVLSEIETLKQQCKKQKEVIDKTTNMINDYLKDEYSIYTEKEIEVDLIVKLKNILKEVSK